LTHKENKTPEEIRSLRALHTQMRERDFARIHGISEADLVASHTGLSVERLRADVEVLLNGLVACGEIMVLTRNESAVHENIGIVEELVIGPMASMTLGENIDLRVFSSRC